MRMSAGGLRRLLLVALAAAFVANGMPQAGAQESDEPISAVLQSVDPATRRVTAGGQEYVFSVTGVVKWQSGQRLDLASLIPGTRVVMELERGITSGGRPVIRTITLPIS